MDPEKTTSGMAVIAADCAGLQPGVVQGSGAAYHTLLTSVIRRAVSPPPFSGQNVYASFSDVVTKPAANPGEPRQLDPAIPPITPPEALPLPTRTCQTISPLRSGSSA